ncbi:MAG: hypothetical protein K2N15_06275 [Lachnospiraceae bacterium]|nr:hypothetical protein [Lachnospiraceae bacterium]
MKKAMCYTIFVACFAICILLAGCGNAGQEKVEIVSDATESSVEEVLSESETTVQDVKENDFAGLSPEQIDAYQQLTLYIQEGFRTYRIEGIYQAYFGEIEGEDGKYACDILLEGEDELWGERISYTYDEQSGWYSFKGQWECIFTKDSFWALREDDSFAKEIRKNYVYQTQIVKNLDIAVSIHYDSENGPIEHDERQILPFSEVMGRYVQHYLYTYYDDRMDIYITIEYPQVWLEDDELEERINAALREAFFYTYGVEEKEWNPGGEAYSDINRNYVITREDETYFSMRIYEYNSFRGANHPNEWETGITINMQTGEVLQLRDVIGDDWTLVSLLDTGAFQCLSFWEDGSNEESSEWWLQDVREQWENDDSDSLDEMDSDFYLTQDGLGLITFVSRYYTPIEAKFEDLGVEFGTRE